MKSLFKFFLLIFILLFPLSCVTWKKDHKKINFLPILRYENDKQEKKKEFDLIWPLIKYKNDENEKVWRLLPLASIYKIEEAFNDEEQSVMFIGRLYLSFFSLFNYSKFNENGDKKGYLASISNLYGIIKYKNDDMQIDGFRTFPYMQIEVKKNNESEFKYREFAPIFCHVENDEINLNNFLIWFYIVKFKEPDNKKGYIALPFYMFYENFDYFYGLFPVFGAWGAKKSDGKRDNEGWYFLWPFMTNTENNFWILFIPFKK